MGNVFTKLSDIWRIITSSTYIVITKKGNYVHSQWSRLRLEEKTTEFKSIIQSLANVIKSIDKRNKKEIEFIETDTERDIMSGNSESAKKAYQTRLSRHGKDHIKNMHSAGGKSSHVGGFGTDKVGEDGLTGKERARMASQESHKVRGHNYVKEYSEENTEDKKDPQI